MLKSIFRITRISLVVCLSHNAFADTNTQYQHAVLQAALHQASTQPTALTTIQDGKVKMVVYTTYDGYKISDTTMGATVWATVAPDVKEACAQYQWNNPNRTRSQKLNLWIAQLLGLPATDADKRRFVEIEVPTIQAYYGSANSHIGIFRPCTDPRITPHNDGSPICPKLMDMNDPNISPDFKTWFINNSINAYQTDNGAPWTEYGYTYNWNKSANNNFGVSEFVILKGTPMTVIPNQNDATSAYTTAEEYCK